MYDSLICRCDFGVDKLNKYQHLCVFISTGIYMFCKENFDEDDETGRTITLRRN